MTKIGELRTKDVHFVVYYDTNKTTNPYYIFNKWYEHGWHKKLMIRYQDLYSCVLYIEDYIHRNYQ